MSGTLDGSQPGDLTEKIAFANFVTASLRALNANCQRAVEGASREAGDWRGEQERTAGVVGDAAVGGGAAREALALPAHRHDQLLHADLVHAGRQVLVPADHAFLSGAGSDGLDSSTDC